MIFEYLHLGRYMHVQEFLQHIEEIGHIELPAGSTFTHLATELREKYQNDPKRLAAVNDWINLNMEGESDPNTAVLLEHKGYLTYNFKKD